METVAANAEIVNIIKFLLLSLTNCIRFNGEFQINNCHLLSRLFGLKKPYKCTSEVHLYYLCYAVMCELKKNNFTNNIIDDFQVKISEMNYYLISKYDWLTTNKIKDFNMDTGDIMLRLCTILESTQKYIPTNIGTVFISDIIRRTKKSIVFAGTLLHNDGTTLNIAIKILPLSDAAKTEGHISMLLSGKPGIPLYFCNGNYDNMFYYIVMELLGPSLSFKTVHQNKAQQMSFGFINYVVQFINIMKILYLERMFHLDITVSNILFGLNKFCDTIYLIDYHDIGNDINITNEEFNRITNGCLHHSIMYILTSMINDYDDIFYYEAIIIKIITNPIETPHFDLLIECISKPIPRVD
jgi:hypothetical protein